MVVQALIDSLSRCLGAPGGVGTHTHSHPHAASNNVNGVNAHGVNVHNVLHNDGKNGTSNNPKSGEANDSRRRNIYNRHAEEGEAMAARRRQGRALGLELHDQEWDALFERDAANKGKHKNQVKYANNNNYNNTSNNNMRESSRKNNGKNGNTDHSTLNTSSAEEGSGSGTSTSRSVNNNSDNSKFKSPDMDVGYADVLAKAKEAAQPSRHATPRKSAIDRKAEIFRTRQIPNPSFASRLLASDAVFKALCFANPVNDCSINMNYGGKNKNSSSDPNGDGADACTIKSDHSTAEDTMTSTIYFENKYNHQVETRPPMPLFTRYKVDCDEIKDNELMGIVNSGSHQSSHMLKEFQHHNLLNYPSLFGGNNTSPVHVTPVADDLLQDLDNSHEHYSTTGGSKRNNASPMKSQQELNQVRYRSSNTNTVVSSTHHKRNDFPFKGERPPAVQAISDSMSTNNSNTSPSHSRSMSSVHMNTSANNSAKSGSVQDSSNNNTDPNDSRPQQVFAI